MTGLADGTVALQPLDETLLAALLAVAMTDAEPDEVIPPVDGPPGWTPTRVEFFRAFHRDRFAGLDGPQRSLMFAVFADDRVVGMIRLSRTDEPGVMETGMWLGRPARGRGLGAAALRALAAEAGRAGAHAVVAHTTFGNARALGALRRCGAELRQDEASGEVHAQLSVRQRSPRHRPQ